MEYGSSTFSASVLVDLLPAKSSFLFAYSKLVASEQPFLKEVFATNFQFKLNFEKETTWSSRVVVVVVLARTSQLLW